MLIHKNDTVEVGADGHKYARSDIKAGDAIIKYGFVIGHATCDIKAGEHVHTHNVRTALGEKLEYTYNYRSYGIRPTQSDLFFEGYVRKSGDVGIRNDIFIIPTVGCVNGVARKIATLTGAVAFEHPYGCSQLGGDHEITQKILVSLIKHPNAGGVLVLGLGCENNQIEQMQELLGDYDSERIKFLKCQSVENEIDEGVAIVESLKRQASEDKREKININRLKIGLKCGGSDAFSGITANVLVGAVCDKICSFGGACALSEVPEMFGAEHILMERCVSRDVFDRTVSLINDFKDYFVRHGQVVYENPSPGNKAGGITTLEEKSLGCVQKGGHADVVDVLTYGDTVTKSGLSLVNGPGNDIVACTNLGAVGVHMILFTTGRGTPLGGPVPTIKISTNRELARNKPSWIDFDASPILDGITPDALSSELISLILSVASGKKTKNEENGFTEIAIFKDGVTL